MQTLQGRTCVFAGASAGDGVACVKGPLPGRHEWAMMTHNASRAQALVDEIASLSGGGL